MRNINNLTIIGRAVDAPKITKGDNFTFANLQIAVNSQTFENGNWSDYASFFDVSISGSQADKIAPLITKGTKIAIQGFLKQERWETAEGGKASKVIIKAEQIELLGKPTN